jgi:putative flippase GtrA
MADPLKMKALAKRLWRSWATRSLAIGAVATVLDILLGISCLSLFAMPTRVSAMLGVVVGASFTFFANRYFAFKEKNPKLTKPAVTFIIATAVSMLIHGQFVVLMRDHAGIPFVLAKMIADIGVFSVGQLFLLRYLVFPKKQPATAAAPTVIENPASSFNAATSNLASES